MKRLLTVVALAALASTAYAAVAVTSAPGLGCIPPTVQRVLADTYGLGEAPARNGTAY